MLLENEQNGKKILIIMVQCQKDQKAQFLRIKTQFYFVYTNTTGKKCVCKTNLYKEHKNNRFF